MFVRIRHGSNEELIVNPNCAVATFLKYIRRNLNVDWVEFDSVISWSEDPVVIVESRLELTAESGLVQGLDDLRPNESASQLLCPENGASSLNRDGQTGQHFVLVEKKLLSLSTDENQLNALKKSLEADGRRLYEKTLGGVVSVVKTSSGRGRRGSAAISGSRSSSPTNSLKSASANRPSSSNNMKPIDSSAGPSLSSFGQERSANSVVERFYYHPLLSDIYSALPDFVVHRPDDKSVGVRPKLTHRGGLSNRSSVSGSGRLSPSPRVRRRSSGYLASETLRRSPRSPVNHGNN